MTLHAPPDLGAGGRWRVAVVPGTDAPVTFVTKMVTRVAGASSPVLISQSVSYTRLTRLLQPVCRYILII